MKLDKQALIDAFKAADKAARDAEPAEDGGSCNFDTPVIKLPRVRATLVHECAADAGIRVSPAYYGAGRWLVHVYAPGQAYKRTKTAEAARDALQAAGFDAAVDYRLD